MQLLKQSCSRGYTFMSENLEHYWLPFSRCDIDPYHQQHFSKFHEISRRSRVTRGFVVSAQHKNHRAKTGKTWRKLNMTAPWNFGFAEKMGFGFLVSRLQFPGESLLEKHSLKLIWLVVSNIFYFHPNLGKIPILTNTGIFQMGWNHQLVMSLHLK